MPRKLNFARLALSMAVNRAIAEGSPVYVNQPATPGTEPTSTLPPDPDGQNDDRASWAESAIQAFIAATSTDREDALADLLADLMHWADRNATDFDDQLNRARTHYDAETGGELVSCRKCGKFVAYRSAVIDHGTGPEEGNEFYYCSLVCQKAH